MRLRIVAVATRTVRDASVLQINSATVDDSAPFSGIFEVADLDRCLRTDLVNGRQYAQVLCRWEDDQSNTDTMILGIQDPTPTGITSFTGEVVARLGRDPRARSGG